MWRHLRKSYVTAAIRDWYSREKNRKNMLFMSGLTEPGAGNVLKGGY